MIFWDHKNMLANKDELFGFVMWALRKVHFDVLIYYTKMSWQQYCQVVAFDVLHWVFSSWTLLPMQYSLPL